jgi:hypothetical protein
MAIVEMKKEFDNFLETTKASVINSDPMISAFIDIDFVNNKCTLTIYGVEDTTEDEKSYSLETLSKGISAIKEYLMDY